MSFITFARKFSHLLQARERNSSHLYLDDEFRSPIKEKGDFELEFIRDVFASKYFDPAKC